MHLNFIEARPSKVQIPKLEDAEKKVEEILSESLGGDVKIHGYHSANNELIRNIILIDSAKFRKELQYDEQELKQRTNNPGFYCIIVYLDGIPVAFDYGYDDAEKGVFFSDSEATLIERKGIGRLLGILELLYLYWNGYDTVKFTTEEMDQDGRPLRMIWEKQGYRVAASYPDGGVDMILEITPSIVDERTRKNLH